MPVPCQHLSVSIDRPVADVVAFAGDPTKLPLWAEGLAQSQGEPDGARWRLDSPLGQVWVQFAEPNLHGVLDHWVTAGETTWYNPLRVFANGSGSEVVFTLFHWDGQTAEQIAADAAQIQRDLKALRAILQGEG